MGVEGVVHFIFYMLSLETQRSLIRTSCSRGGGRGTLPRTRPTDMARRCLSCEKGGRVAHDQVTLRLRGFCGPPAWPPSASVAVVAHARSELASELSVSLTRTVSRISCGHRLDLLQASKTRTRGGASGAGRGGGIQRTSAHAAAVAAEGGKRTAGQHCAAAGRFGHFDDESGSRLPLSCPGQPLAAPFLSLICDARPLAAR